MGWEVGTFMTTAGKHHVIIKGVKDGLNFLLDDSCELATVLEELRHKVESTHDRILTGPIVRVQVRLGKRSVSDEEKEEIRAIIGQKGNLLIQSIESDEPEPLVGTAAPITMLKGMVRSGQTLKHEGNLLYMGMSIPEALYCAPAASTSWVPCGEWHMRVWTGTRLRSLRHPICVRLNCALPA